MKYSSSWVGVGSWGWESSLSRFVLAGLQTYRSHWFNVHPLVMGKWSQGEGLEVKSMENAWIRHSWRGGGQALRDEAS